MSDFHKYLAQQLEDPEFREWWNAYLHLLVENPGSHITLSGMELTEADKERIRFAMEHPAEFDRMLDKLFQETTGR